MQPNQTPGAVIWRHEGSLATTGHLLSREQVFDGGDVSAVTPFVAQHLPRRPCRSLAWCPPDRAGIFWISSFCLFWFMFHSLQPAKAGLLTIAEVAQGAPAQMQHKVPNARSAVPALLHARHACEACHTGTFTAQAHPPLILNSPSAEGFEGERHTTSHTLPQLPSAVWHSALGAGTWAQVNACAR